MNRVIVVLALVMKVSFCVFPIIDVGLLIVAGVSCEASD
jgi:hypothetical protein